MDRLDNDSSDPFESVELDELIRYYSEAGVDYSAWSSNYNMHFGYCDKGSNPFALEAMLANMNRRVFNLIGLQDGRWLDMGCGLGEPARDAVRAFSDVQVTAVTIVPWQVEQARRLTQRAGLEDRIDFQRQNYTATDFDDGCFDAAYALESFCYASGYAKRDFLQEAYRVLKPGAPLVIADGFLKKTTPMNPVLDYCLRKSSQCWEVGTFAGLAACRQAMRDVGFRDIVFRDISYRIAPSVCHVPLVSLRFLLGKLLKREKMTPKRWNNVIAPLLGMAVGLARSRFGYYLVSARKP